MADAGADAPAGLDHAAVIDGLIDLPRLVRMVGDPGVGAIATFLGVTRDNFQGEWTTTGASMRRMVARHGCIK